MSRILMVVQRYGAEVAGGAETLCRELAVHMVGRGHEVSVLTSCALEYSTWGNEFASGLSDVAGVRVRRLPVESPRDPDRFASMSARVLGAGRTSPVVQQAWFREEGPTLASFEPVLHEEAGTHDVTAFFTYLYAPTVTGLPAVSAARPTVLHPTAHDELPFRIPMVRQAFDRCSGLAFSTHEEQELVRRRFRPSAVESVIGIGFDPAAPGDGSRFRARWGLGERPYLLYLGRIDPNKGADEAIAYMRAYRERNDADVTLVMVGAQAMPATDEPGIVLTGFVDEAERWDALAGATALLQPSYQESFSMALAESWLMSRPALVQGNCDVLDGFARRAGGAITYREYAEFEAGLDVLLDAPNMADEMGRAGMNHIVAVYGWDAVAGRYEQLIDDAAANWSARRAPGDVRAGGPAPSSRSARQAPRSESG